MLCKRKCPWRSCSFPHVCASSDNFAVHLPISHWRGSGGPRRYAHVIDTALRHPTLCQRAGPAGRPSAASKEPQRPDHTDDHSIYALAIEQRGVGRGARPGNPYGGGPGRRLGELLHVGTETTRRVRLDSCQRSKSAAAAAAACSCRRSPPPPSLPPALPPPAPLRVQRAPMRLRQLESVAGRGLLLGAGSKQQAPAAHYVTLAARCPSALGSGETSGSGGEEEWSLVYRSEAVRRRERLTLSAAASNAAAHAMLASECCSGGSTQGASSGSVASFAALPTLPAGGWHIQPGMASPDLGRAPAAAARPAAGQRFGAAAAGASCAGACSRCSGPDSSPGDQRH